MIHAKSVSILQLNQLMLFNFDEKIELGRCRTKKTTSMPQFNLSLDYLQIFSIALYDHTYPGKSTIDALSYLHYVSDFQFNYCQNISSRILSLHSVFQQCKTNKSEFNLSVTVQPQLV